MKVGLFFKNERISDIDASKPEEGNPGFGGREFMNLSIAYYLKKNHLGSLEPTLYTEVYSKLPRGLSFQVVGDLFLALKQSQKDGVSFFILDVTLDFSRMKEILSVAEACSVKTIVRLGLFPSPEILKLLSESISVVAVVCVEQHASQMLKDHDIFKKVVVMRNAISFLPFRDITPYTQRNSKRVVYLGSVTPQKGFGMLAKVWLNILDAHPDAELHVIGSGKVYARDNVMGEWGIAHEDFECEYIRPYLAGKNGKPNSSVYFHGAMGKEKIKIIETAQVGIANPSGHTETFCISAVELQAAGLPVIAGARGGLFDTVSNNNSGYLVSTENELEEKIVYILDNLEHAKRMSNCAVEFVQEKYDFDNISLEWARFLLMLEQQYPIYKIPWKYYTVEYPRYIKIIRMNAWIRHILRSPGFWLSYVEVWVILHRIYHTFKRLILFR